MKEEKNNKPTPDSFMLCEPFLVMKLCSEYYVVILAVDTVNRVIHVKDAYNNNFQLKLCKGRDGLAKFKFRGSDYYIGIKKDNYYPYKVSCGDAVYVGKREFMRPDVITCYSLKQLSKFRDRFLQYR